MNDPLLWLGTFMVFGTILVSRLVRVRGTWIALLVLGGCALLLADDTVKHDWWGFAAFGIGLLIGALWHWWRRRGRRAASRMGAKTRLIFARMAARMRGREPHPVPA